MQTTTKRIMLGAVFAIFLAAPATAPARSSFSTAPPDGIVPTTATLQQVLTAHRKAIGNALDPNASLVEDGTLTQDGMSGTYHQVTAGGAYMTTYTIGPFTTSSGYSDGQAWAQDKNGQVVHVEGVHQRGNVDAEALDTAISTHVDSVKLLGEVSNPVSAYVVEVNPPDGRREWVFYDKKTALVDRTETLYGTRREVNTYSDFRVQNGMTEPWQEHSTDGDPLDDSDWHVQSQRADVNVDPASLQMPQSKSLITFPDPSKPVDLPVRIIDGRIVLRVTVKGKGYDLLLDSGSSNINLDYAAAQQMGLTLYGKGTGVATGKFSTSASVVPEMDVGVLSMHNVAVSVIPFTEEEDLGTDVVGLLGFDFINSAVLRIDYDNRAAQAYPPDAYVPPPDAFAIPAVFDDYVPVVSAQIGNAFGDHFILDTGANKGFLFNHFVSAHPDDVRDRGGGALISENYFSYASGVGGYVSLKPTQVSAFHLGGVEFADWVVYKEDSAGLEDEDYDGLIGYDFLRYFNVVFDDREGLIYLEPNATFNRSVDRGR